MADLTVESSNLASAIESALQEYSQQTTEAVKEETKAAAEYCRDEIKRRASESFGSGPYSKSWRARKTFESANDITFEVHSSQPGLPHLLEFGHAKWLWGKETGERVAGRAHIRPAEQDTEKRFEGRIKLRLKR